MALFCLAIGRDPGGLTLAVVNEDAGTQVADVDGGGGVCGRYTSGCVLGDRGGFFGDFDYSTAHRGNLSCRYLRYRFSNARII